MKLPRIFALLVLMLTYTNAALAQITVGTNKQLSKGLNGASPLGTSGTPALSPNSKFFAFRSDASNIIENDTNSSSDIFIGDAISGSIARASVSSSQIAGDDDSTDPAISPVGPDGFYVVGFASRASNLSSISNPNGDQHIYLRFPKTSITLPISFGSGPVIGDDNSRAPSVTINSAPNKALVVYASDAENIVSGFSNFQRDIFLATVIAPTSAAQDPTTLVSNELITKSSTGTSANGSSETPKISGDGKFVVFSSRATNLVSGRTTSNSQIFLYEVATHAISLLSQTSQGTQGNDDSTVPVISFTGRYVAYLTDATNLISNPVNNRTALVVLDRLTGTTTRVNSKSDGTAGIGSASDPIISANGRLITFADDSDNLVDGDTNNQEDVFVKELETGAISLASLPSTGVTDGDSDTCFINGKSYNALSGFVSFRSFASNLSDTSTGGGGDVFVTGATFNTPTLSNQTRLEAPADVTVSGKQAKIVVQKFKKATTSGGFASAVSLRAAKTTIKYDIRIDGTGARKKDRFRIISAKNSTSQRNLKPGIYSAKYRTVTQQGTKTVSATPFSPRQRFEIN